MASSDMPYAYVIMGKRWNAFVLMPELANLTVQIHTQLTPKEFNNEKHKL